MTLTPGKMKTKDPDAKKNAAFDWSAFLGTAIILTRSVFVTGPDSALTVDSVAPDVTNQKVTYRLLGGTSGQEYLVTCRITTNEAPDQQLDKSIRVWVEDQ